jgi:cation diffusion facilitator CzcD-associated flavoprotein CzcO
MPTAPTSPIRTSVAIIGAGFGGLGAAIALKAAGEHDLVILERASEVGGTWRDNTYPGCRCDVQSNLYSFSFAPNPDWTNTFPSQPELFDYLRDVAATNSLRHHIRFGIDVTSVDFDSSIGRWRLTSADGTQIVANSVILATGGLAEPKRPELPGLDDFAGRLVHSAAWDDDVDLAGNAVGVIGTGASSIQIVPAIVDEVGHLSVFQRTAPWILAHPGKATSARARHLYRRLPFAQKVARTVDYWLREWLVVPFAKRPSMMAKAESTALEHLRAQVADPALRAKLTPDYRLGCKRILMSDEYYPALQRPHVDLVTTPIERVTTTGVRLVDGTEVPLDVLVLATGFHVTDNPTASKVHGVGGVALADAYAGKLPCYRGTSFPGFPNLFMITGPNTALGHSSMVFMIESQLPYITEAIAIAGDADLIEPRREVAVEEEAALQAKLPGTVWGSGCASWYLTENGRNVTIWPDFTFAFRRRLRHLVPAHHVVRARPTPDTTGVVGSN